eukprot:gene17919-17764_t
MFTVNWEAFTPYPALFGGLLIGLSAVMLILLTGRVAGISGIVGGLLKPQHGETLWRLTFVLGMAAAPWLYQAMVGRAHIVKNSNTGFAVVSGIAGLVFGWGLIISGMANPAKVIGFLDLSMPWDPSLMFVMGGAIALGLPGFLLAKRLKNSLMGMPMNLPTHTQIDKKLLLGAVLFGAGWGIGGFCPGPAV